MCVPTKALRFANKLNMLAERTYYVPTDSYTESRREADKQLAEAIKQIPQGMIDMPKYRFDWLPVHAFLWDFYRTCSS